VAAVATEGIVERSRSMRTPTAAVSRVAKRPLLLVFPLIVLLRCGGMVR
jgi:hypothetical protein